MNAETLRSAMLDRITLDHARALVPHYNAALLAANCTTVNRSAMFAAQIGHESASLRYMEEIASGAAYEGRRDLGNTQRGDGKRFKGRGPIQLTGRNNYGLFSKWCHGRGLVPTPSHFVDRPTEVATPRWGFLAAAWYWVVARPRINGMCDAADLVGVTRAINGGTNGLADRRMRWEHCRKLGNRLLPDAAPSTAPAAVSNSSPALGTDLVMDPIAFPAGAPGRRIFLDPPGARVIEAAWFSWVVDGPDGANATATLFPQKAGGGTGREKAVTSRVRVDGSHTVDRDVFAVPAGTDQITVWGPKVSPGAVAYLVPAFRAAK